MKSNKNCFYLSNNKEFLILLLLSLVFIFLLGCFEPKTYFKYDDNNATRYFSFGSTCKQNGGKYYCLPNSQFTFYDSASFVFYCNEIQGEYVNLSLCKDDSNVKRVTRAEPVVINLNDSSIANNIEIATLDIKCCERVLLVCTKRCDITYSFNVGKNSPTAETGIRGTLGHDPIISGSLVDKGEYNLKPKIVLGSNIDPNDLGDANDEYLQILNQINANNEAMPSVEVVVVGHDFDANVYFEDTKPGYENVFYFDTEEDLSSIDKKFYVSIKNTNPNTISLSNINISSSNTNLLQINSFDKPTVDLDQGEFVTITVYGTFKKPEKSPVEISINVKANVTDQPAGLSTEEISRNVTIRVFLIENQRYLLKMKGSSNVPECFSADGLIGNVGNNKLRVKYSWDWQSIDINTCDPSSNPNYVYCDATQFTISLMKRLSLIYNISRSTNISIGEKSNKISSLSSFQAALMKDAFSEDFFADFNNYMLIREPTTIQDYKDCLNHYLSEDTDTGNIKLKFILDGNIFRYQSGGIYDVNLIINHTDNQTSKYSFCKSTGEGIATTEDINVVFSKKKEIVEDRNHIYDSLLYHLPINGMIGYDENNNCLDRNGYGVDFNIDSVDDSQVIYISKEVQFKKKCENSSALATLKLRRDTNLNSFFSGDNGKIYTLTRHDDNKYSMTYYPSCSIGLVAKPQNISTDGRYLEYVALAYSLAENDYMIKEYPSFFKWYGFAESITNQNCTDYSNEVISIDYIKPDGSLTNIYSNKAYRGIYWNYWDPNRINESIFLLTYVFVPFRNNYSYYLKTVNGTFYFYNRNRISEISEKNFTYDLTSEDNFCERLDSQNYGLFESLVRLVNNTEKLGCYYIDPNEIGVNKIYWNAKKINDSMLPAIYQLFNQDCSGQNCLQICAYQDSVSRNS